MKRIVKIFALAGAVLPVILTIAFIIASAFDSGEIIVGSPIVFYLWPSSFMLLGPRNSLLASIVLLTMSIAINVLLYAFVGILIKYVWLLTSRWKR